MAPETLLALEGLLGVMIPVLAISVGGLLLLSRSRLGEALARRIAGDSAREDQAAHLAALEDDIVALRSQLGETQERLDFAERLLTRREQGAGEPGLIRPPDAGARAPADTPPS